MIEEIKMLSDIINCIRIVVFVFKVELEKLVDKYLLIEIKKGFCFLFFC